MSWWDGLITQRLHAQIQIQTFILKDVRESGWLFCQKQFAGEKRIPLVQYLLSD